jgi:hypothetical protein
MFDYLRVEIPLPTPLREDTADGLWQTKSLDCELAEYTLTADGVLLYGSEVYPHTGDFEFHDGRTRYHGRMWAGTLRVLTLNGERCWPRDFVEDQE